MTGTVEPFDERDDPPDRATRTPAPRRPRRLIPAVVGVVLIVLIGVAYVAWVRKPDMNAQSSTALADETATAVVTAGPMVSERSLPGTLQYSARQPVAAELSGVITHLPKVGTTMTAGDVLFRVDTKPVILLLGRLPVWRTLASGIPDGEDVRQLERNLRRFGFFHGEPDRRFSGNTVSAVERWQKSLGLEPTGEVISSMIVFSPQELRVDSLTTRMGAHITAGTTVYQATSRTIVADLKIQLDDRGLAVPRETVKIDLPTGLELKGVIATVGSPLSQAGQDGGEPSVVVPVRITTTDQKAVRELAMAGISVRFASTFKKDVLSVPVDALVPTDETHFAVERPRRDSRTERRLIPVTVGTFASGRVEISGPDITQGMSVVVPAS